MRTRTEILAERDALLREGMAILDQSDVANRAMTDAEKKRSDEITAKVEQLNEELGGTGYEGKPRIPRPQPSNELNDDEILPIGARRPAAVFNPGTKLQAFANNKHGHAEAFAAGQWIAAVFYGSVKAQDWCRQNGIDTRAALSGGTNTGGGALVPEPLERSIIALRDMYGTFRRVCRVVPMTSDTLYIPRRVGGIEAFFVGEGVAGTESDPSFDNVGLVAKKLMTLTRVSSELNEDAIIALADYIAQEFGLAFAEKEDRCGFNGDGTSTYGGIVGAFVKALDAAHTKAKVTAAGAGDSCDALDEITGDHLLALMGAIPGYAKKGSRWYCSPTALELVFNAIKIAAGGNQLENLAGAVEPRFLGYPIELLDGGILPDNPAADLSGLVMIAFGNLGLAATMGDRRGMRLRVSEHAHFAEDQIALKATERFDVNVHDLGSTTVKSPFAVLVGN
jgi:HK97 family phage major capsid protein